jgi:hypothetical protein
MSNVIELKFKRVVPFPDEVAKAFYTGNTAMVDKFLTACEFEKNKPLDFLCGYGEGDKFIPLKTNTIVETLGLFKSLVIDGDEDILLCAAQERRSKNQ